MQAAGRLTGASRLVRWVLPLWCVLSVGCSGRTHIDPGPRVHLGREYLLHVPSSLAPDAPLVLVMHGYGGDASSMRQGMGWIELADREGFVVCFPNGTLDESGRRFWNVGYEMHEESGVDDTAYLVGLARILHASHGLDPDSTFATGFSNGADMSYLLACESPGTFRAIGPVAGTMMDSLYERPGPAIPCSVIAFNGTGDTITLFDGDMRNADGWGAYRPVPEVISFWVDLNDLPNRESKVIDIPDGDGSSGAITLERHWSRRHRREVHFYRLSRGGHDWPRSSSGAGIDATTLIWDFFDRASRYSHSPGT